MPKRSARAAGAETPSRVTSYDVARLAGVSQAVVSRAFSANSPIHPETRAKVLQVAREIGYRPNGLARGLVSDSSDLVAIVISNIRASPWRAALLESIEAELRRHDRQPMLFMTGRDETTEELIPSILQYQPNGIIIASGTISSKVAEKCAALRTPVVQINRPSRFAGVYEVSCNNHQGGRQAAEVLIHNGHRNIALLGGFRNTHTGVARYRGFVAALRGAGLKLMDEIQCGSSYGEAFQAATDYLALGKLPTGVFCTSDIRAFALMNAARYRFGLHIPDDLSVVGFDDIEDARLPPYRLTTVHHSAPTLAARAVEHLLAPSEEQGRACIIKPTLVLRDTVGRVPSP